MKILKTIGYRLMYYLIRYYYHIIAIFFLDYSLSLSPSPSREFSSQAEGELKVPIIAI